MRAIRIDLGSEVPAYRQIASEVRGLVARGELVEGEELPSVRQLGQMLGVNLNTVAKAYRILADEGLIELRQGAPSRVLGGSRPVPRATTRASAPMPPELEGPLREVFGKLLVVGEDREGILEQVTRALDRFLELEAPKGGRRRR